MFSTHMLMYSIFLVTVLNTQIESAIDSLEHTLDPSFPDLLVRIKINN